MRSGHTIEVRIEIWAHYRGQNWDLGTLSRSELRSGHAIENGIGCMHCHRVRLVRFPRYARVSFAQDLDRYARFAAPVSLTTPYGSSSPAGNNFGSDCRCRCCRCSRGTHGAQQCVACAERVSACSLCRRRGQCNPAGPPCTTRPQLM